MIIHASSKSNITVLIVVIACVALHAKYARADLIAFTSFEDPPIASTAAYTDTLDASNDHALPTHIGEPCVNWTSTGSDQELGFASFYSNTRNSVGLTDGDNVGVTNPNNSQYGLQAFQMSDTDGLMTTVLDPVSLQGITNPSVSLNLFINPTGWEVSDQIRIWLVLDGATENDIFNTQGQDIDNLGLEGNWLEYSASLVGYDSAQLAFSLDSNSGPEFMLIDNIRFEGDTATVPAPVPVPASSILGALGLACANWLRRRMQG